MFTRRAIGLATVTVMIVSGLFPTAARATACRVPTGGVCMLGACPPNSMGFCAPVTCETTNGCPQPPPTAPATTGRAIELPFQPVQPVLQVPIPGLPRFSALEAREAGGVRTIDVPWIGEYIAAAYRFALPVGAILATLIIMVAGVIRMASGGSTQRISTSQEWIRNAVVGLILLLGSYVILSIANPDLVRLQNIQVRIIRREAVVPETEPDAIVAPAPGIAEPVVGPNIQTVRTVLVDGELLGDLRAAAAVVQGRGYEFLVTSGLRSIAEQRTQITANCKNPPGSLTCDPRSGKPPTCILRSGPESCPHTSGRAVDAWGMRGGNQCVSRAACLGNRDGCRANPCQAAVIQAMRSRGFCNLSSEPWHFEKPKMSPNCS